MTHEALSAHARDELRISDTLGFRPVQAAFASAGTFAIGAERPLLTAMLTSQLSLIPAVVATSILFLALINGFGAYAGGDPWLKAFLRVTFWGALAMVLTTGVGAVFGTAVGFKGRTDINAATLTKEDLIPLAGFSFDKGVWQSHRGPTCILQLISTKEFFVGCRADAMRFTGLTTTDRTSQHHFRIANMPNSNSPVSLFLTFCWICPDCDHENFVSRSDLGTSSMPSQNLRTSIPLVPVQVVCSQCNAKWSPL